MENSVPPTGAPTELWPAQLDEYLTAIQRGDPAEQQHRNDRDDEQQGAGGRGAGQVRGEAPHVEIGEVGQGVNRDVGAQRQRYGELFHGEYEDEERRCRDGGQQQR